MPDERIEPPSDCVCPRCDHAVAGAQPGQRIDCWYCRHVYRAPAIGPPFDSDEDDWDIAPLPPRKRYHVVLRPPRDDYAWDASAGWWVLDVG